jgi:hypothetical protein
LREENNGVFIISEVIVCLEIVDNLIVVHIACHQIPFNEAFRVVYTCFALREITQTFESMCKMTEKREATFQTQIEHSLRMIESQSCALASTHDTHRNFSKFNTFYLLAMAMYPSWSNTPA